MAWTALPQIGSGAQAVEQRRYEYLKLLRQTPAISELLWIDRNGKEQLRVSRLALDVAGAGTDYSDKPAFKTAAAGNVYYGPVYFRKETEPYMTISRPAGGSAGGVIVAEVNLKFVWEVITQIKVGAKWSRLRGEFRRHPDRPSGHQPRPSEDRSQPPAPGECGYPSCRRCPGRANTTLPRPEGRSVLSAHAPIPHSHWHVFVEMPLEEAFAPLYGSNLPYWMAAACRTGAFGAREPVPRAPHGAADTSATSRRGENRCRAARAAHRCHTGDELEALAGQFNSMRHS